MKNTLALILLCASSVHAIRYTDSEITDFLNQEFNKSSTLTRQIFTQASPEKTLKAWLRSDTSELEKEYQIQTLLNHLAESAPDAFYDPLLQLLSQHQPLAVKTQQEAHHPDQAVVAVFPIASQAVGVQNIWHMKRTQQLATQFLFDKHHPIEQLVALYKKHDNKRNATRLGIKQALKDINDDQLQQIKHHLMDGKHIATDAQNLMLDILAVKQDVNFAQWALEASDKTSAEHVLKLAITLWTEPTAVQLLTSNHLGQANKSLAASLLAKYPNNIQANNHLITQISDPKATTGAAYALSKSTNPWVWKKLAQIHQNNPSEVIKKSIRFSMKQSQSPEAQQRLKSIQKQGAPS